MGMQEWSESRTSNLTACTGAGSVNKSSRNQPYKPHLLQLLAHCLGGSVSSAHGSMSSSRGQSTSGGTECACVGAGGKVSVRVWVQGGGRVRADRACVGAGARASAHVWVQGGSSALAGNGWVQI